MYFFDEEEVIRLQTGFAYSLSSTVFLHLFLLYVFASGSHLSLGTRSVWSTVAVVAAFELTKWFYIQSQRETPFYVPSRKSNLLSGGGGPSGGPGTSSHPYASYLRSVNFGLWLKSGSVVLLGVVVWAVIAVLFGAPVLRSNEETAMFAVLMSALTVFPICLNLGYGVVLRLPTGWRPSNTFQTFVYRNSLAALIGAWIGAFVIPLDWDRPWQAWPVPCSCGALFGYTMNHLVHFVEFGVTSSWKCYKVTKKKR